MQSSILLYQQIIELFVEGKISALQFESEYLNLFKHDKCHREEVYSILNKCFWAVEDFCIYPELRDENNLDENQLLCAAKIALNDLNAIRDDKK